MSDMEQLDNEGLGAILGLILVKLGDVTVSEEMVSLGLPEDSRIAVFWDDTDDNLVIGIRPNSWNPEDK